MQYRFPLFAFAHVVATVLTLVLAVVVYTRRVNHGYRYFSALLLILSFWSATTFMEVGALDVTGKRFWSQWQYLAIVSLAPVWLLFAASLNHKNKFLSSPWRHLLWAIPMLTLLAAFTDQYYGLLWGEITIPASSHHHIAVYGRGPVFFVHAIYSYILLLTGTVWMVQSFLHSPRKQKRQVTIILVLLAVGWLANLIQILGLSPLAGLDLTSLSFTFIALALFWFISRHQLFDLVPVARDKVIDNLTHGVIVINDEDVIVDINPSALDIIGYQGPTPLGISVWAMLAEYADLFQPFRNQTELQKELELPTQPPRFLDVQLSTLKEDNDNNTESHAGHIITIRDITRRKNLEKVQEDQRHLAEALADSAAVINSTLELDEVLDRILENVGEVVPHDAADISLLDEHGNLRFARTHGYDRYSAQGQNTNLKFQLHDIPNMKRMAETGQPCIISNTLMDPDWITDLHDDFWIRSYIGAPIISKGKLLGFLSLGAEQPDFFQTSQIDRLRAFANQAAIAIENAQMYAEMQHLAITDSLSGLYNRRYFFPYMKNEMERARRYHNPLSLIMMDIDHFKEVNDRHGHEAGDRVVKLIAATCLGELRKADVLCRFGGEEFLILLPETPKKEARRVARRICTAVAQAKLPIDGGEIHVTVSLGVVELDDSHNDINALIKAADLALYQAKEAGRNRVVVA